MGGVSEPAGNRLENIGSPQASQGGGIFPSKGQRIAFAELRFDISACEIESIEPRDIATSFGTNLLHIVCLRVLKGPMLHAMGSARNRNGYTEAALKWFLDDVTKFQSKQRHLKQLDVSLSSNLTASLASNILTKLSLARKRYYDM